MAHDTLCDVSSADEPDDRCYDQASAVRKALEAIPNLIKRQTDWDLGHVSWPFDRAEHLDHVAEIARANGFVVTQTGDHGWHAVLTIPGAVDIDGDPARFEYVGRRFPANNGIPARCSVQYHCQWRR